LHEVHQGEKNMLDLKSRYGNLALITGASSGIGEQFARQLAAEGFDLLITARREAELQRLASELEQQYSVKVDIAVCDLSNEADLDVLIDKASNLDPGLIVSNAGFGAKGGFLEHDYSRVEDMYKTNSLALSKLAFHLLPKMVEEKRGGFIVTGSVEGEVAFPYSAPYAASKAFVHSLVRSLWLEMKPHNVDVLLLAPGSTDTEAPIKQGMTREQLIGLQTPAYVAEQALCALGKKMVITPGLVNWLFISFFKILPRKWSTIVAGFGMKKAIEDAKK
jgi:short-subunit dehydrogenase